MKIFFSPKTENYLFNLTFLLYQKQYFGYFESAKQYVQSLIFEIRNNIHIKQKRKAPGYFKKYGTDLYYVSFPKNKRTTWYVFFTYHPQKIYYIRYITNNHVAGHLLDE